ncbi:MAG: aminotransferase class V-fold PLP-dependent enzyme, partial [Bryobacter sp.]|nr:aminotransferase class V-fold PLP-dependent enzyme [Bryobacter sp.]
MERYYFDHNATTPVSAPVLEAMTAALRDDYGNASSIHHYGQAAKQRLEAARRAVAATVQAQPEEIVFTSGGTEANNLALFGSLAAGDHFVTTAMEHPAVLHPAAELERRGVAVTVVAVDASGVVAIDALRAALRPETKLISVMAVNNELGTIQPVAETARECGIRLHVDAVQALGKVNVDVRAWGVDLASFSAHKIYGPKGIGALFVRK